MDRENKIIAYDKRKRQIMNMISSFVADFPLNEIYQLRFLQNGRPYLFQLIKEAEPNNTDELDEAISCDNISVDLNDIKELFVMLNDEQREIIMHIYYRYKNKHNTDIDVDRDIEDEENPKIILQGPAGTGKSTIINFIEKLITWEENQTSNSPGKIKVLKTAFTGKAASNINGVTLNHIFSIPIYKTRSLKKKRLDTKKELLEDCIFFICDEISMVGVRLMSSVNMRLKEIFANDKMYGDRFVLLVGDLYQIDPVRQKSLYPNSEFWTCCKFYELTKIMRQQDETFIQALNNFKNSQMTDEDIKLLKSREIQNYNQVPDTVIHIFFQNIYVDEYNEKKISKSNQKEEIVNAIEEDDWTPSNLRVKIDLRYMITYNMDIGDYLANGTTGIVKGFDYDSDGSVSVIWMDFHSNSVGKKARAEYFKNHEKPGFEKYVPIYQSSIVVKLKSNPNTTRKVANMFPLKAAEAITVHKSQGQTYHDGVCIHITNDQYDRLRTDKSLQYVALTRVKRLEDLYIMGNLEFSTVNSDKFTRIEKELNRLRTERRLKLAYETFEEKSGDIVMFLNTGLTFNEHHQFITSDKWYSNGSLLIFTKTNTIASDDIKIPNFEIAYRSDKDTVLRSGGGIICYKDPSKSLDVISSISDENKNTYLTLLEYEKYLYIITGYRGDCSDEYYISALEKLLNMFSRQKRVLISISNFHQKMTPSDSFQKYVSTKKNFTIIKCENGKGECDLLMAGNLNIRFGCYEYIPSANKPYYCILPPNTKPVNTATNTTEPMEIEI